MLKKVLKSTENLFDKKLKNGTVMVLIISLCVTFTWILHSTVNASLSANVMQSQKNTVSAQYIIIDGKKFKILLEEVK